ncbi:MAG: WG repeat-containing protein [candidate division WOR-3 bacterium]
MARLRPSKFGDKWGYIDEADNVSIPPQFENALPFSDGLAPVRVGDKWGYINPDGKIVIAPQFEYAWEFIGDHAEVRLGRRWFRLDKTGALSPQVPKTAAEAKPATSIPSPAGFARPRLKGDPTPTRAPPFRGVIITTIVALTLITLTAGVLVMSWQTSRTPRFALAQMLRALARHDLAGLERHVDLCAISDELLEHVPGLAESNPELRAHGALGQLLSQELAPMFRAQAGPGLVRQLRRWVETGRMDGELGEALTALRLRVSNPVRIYRNGAAAVARLGLHSERYDTMLSLTLSLRKLGSTWQVSGLANLESLQTTLSDLEARHIARLNSRPAEQIRAVVACTDPYKPSSGRLSGKTTQMEISMRLKNLGAQEISKIAAVLHCRTAGGERLRDIEFQSLVPLPPGKARRVSQVVQLNPHSLEDARLFATSDREFRVEAEVQQVCFKDGSELRLAQPIRLLER